MDTCLLTVPARPAFRADISAGIKEYIERVYQQNVVEFLGDIEKLQRLRDATISDPQSEAASEYYGQLGALAPKFPASLNCKLVWGSSLGYGVGSVESNCLQFDRINVAYNLAASITEQAMIYTKNDLPKAFQSYQRAAGIFDVLLVSEMDKFPGQLAIGLDRPTIECLKMLCLAQAQECFWANAAHPRDGSMTVKHTMLAKLAEGVRSLYNEACVFASRSSAIRIEWANHLQAKRDYFEAVARYRMSLECLNLKQYGEEVAWLQAAKSALASATTHSAKIDPLFTNNIQGLTGRVTGDLKRAEQDNNLLYLQNVPHTLPKVTATLAAKPNPEILQAADRKAKAAPLLRLLLPFPVFQAPKAYKEKLELFVDKYIVKECQKLNEKVHNTLTEMHLPGALEAAQRPTEVPAFLIEQHQAIVRAGGIDELRRRRAAVNELRDQIANELTEVRAEIHRAFPQPQLTAIRDVYDETATKFQQLVEYLRVGRASDAKVDDRLAQSEHLIRILVEGSDSIAKFLPDPVNSTPNRELSQVCSDLQAIVGTLLGNAAQRTAYGERAMVKAASMDITGKVMEYVKGRVAPIERASDLDPVYTQLVGEFDPAFIYLKQQKAEVESMLACAAARNQVFHKKLKDLGDKNQMRQLAVEALETASVRYDEVGANIDEGRNFYETLRAEIDKLHQTTIEYTERHAAPQTPQSPISEDEADETSIHSAAPSHSARVTPVSTPRQPMPGAWDQNMPIRFG